MTEQADLGLYQCWCLVFRLIEEAKEFLGWRSGPCVEGCLLQGLFLLARLRHLTLADRTRVSV